MASKPVIPLSRLAALDFGPRTTVWDALWAGRSPGRLAIRLLPNEARTSRVKEQFEFELDDSVPKPENWTADWRQSLVDQLYGIVAGYQLASDGFYAVAVPRFVHGQSQGIVELFGARAERQDDGNYYAHPLRPDPAFVDDVEVRPLPSSLYWNAVEWTRYAHAATHSTLPFRVAIMTGPLDTANYLLGTTTLMEWLYTQPETVHRLLGKITGVIIAFLAAQREAAGGKLATGHFSCMSQGPDLASECRSIVSKGLYEEFEAPYLRRVGEAIGPYGVHSCGSWERTVESALGDPNLRAMNGQSKENDIGGLCRLAGARLTLSMAASINVDDHYIWPDKASFLRHIVETVPDDQPFETTISEDDLDLLMGLHREVRGRDLVLSPPVWTE